MAYKFFRVEFNTPQDLFDLKKPIEVLNQFLDNVGNNRIRSFNFNKYYDPPNGVTIPRIDVRFNLIYREQVNAWAEIQRTARTLINANEISGWNNRLDPWIEPSFVQKAHEPSTA